MAPPSSSLTGATNSQIRWYADDGPGKYPEHFTVNLPALSPTMELGTIVSWEKKEGDQVSEGDLLCEIETDKATMGFETPEEGYLAKILLPAGSKDIPIGRLLCIITANAEDVAKFKDYTAEAETTKKSESSQKKPPSLELDEGIMPKMKPLRQQKTASSAQPGFNPATPPPSRITAQERQLGDEQPRGSQSLPTAGTLSSVSLPMTGKGTTGGDRPFASPAAKKLASERGVDLFAITSGSGMDGMITSKDVEHFVPQAVSAPVTAAAPPAAASPLATPAAPPMGAPRTAGAMPAMMGSGHTDAEITNMRRIIGKICYEIPALT